MFPRTKKWRVTFVLSNGLNIGHVFDRESRAKDHVTNVFTGQVLLRNGHGQSYTAYPPALILEAKFEEVEETTSGHFVQYRGPSFNV